MNVTVGSRNGVVVMRVKCARVDAAVAPELRAALTSLIERGLDRFVVDLTPVTFVDSTGLGALVSALKVTGKPGSVAISAASEPVATLFRLTRMDKVFVLHPTEDAATQAMSRR